MNFETPPFQQSLTDAQSRAISREWPTWMTALYKIVITVNKHGTTAQRPTANLYIGMEYFDDTLGYPVWLKSIGPIVWVRYDGFAA